MTKRQLGLGAVLLAAAALVVVLNIRSAQPAAINAEHTWPQSAPSAPPSGTNARAGITETVEYTVRDRFGNVKEHGIIHGN